MVSREQIADNWNDVVSAVKSRFSHISGEDLRRVQGNTERLISLIQRRTGQSRKQTERFLADCCHTAESTFNQFTDAASNYANRAGHTVRENYDRWASDAQKGYEYSRKTMERRPVESAAVALGIGLIAGAAIALSVAYSRRR